MRMTERTDDSARIPSDLVAAARLRQKMGARLDIPTPDWVRIVGAPSSATELEGMLAAADAQYREARNKTMRRVRLLAAIGIVVFFIAALVVSLYLPEPANSGLIPIVIAVAIALIVTALGIFGSRLAVRSLAREGRELDKYHEELERSVRLARNVAEQIMDSQRKR
jgi:hypothetical protein